MMKQPEQKGVGDTVQWLAANFGGEHYKAIAKKIGLPCNCSNRQDEWNRSYPYPGHEQTAICDKCGQEWTIIIKKKVYIPKCCGKLVAPQEKFLGGIKR